MGNKTDVVVKLVLVLFISLLSFAVGTYVGRKTSDTQHKMASLEPGGSSKGQDPHREVASEGASEGVEAKVAGSESLTDDEIAKLAEEFVTDGNETKPEASHDVKGAAGHEVSHETAPAAATHGAKVQAKPETKHEAKQETKKEAKHETKGETKVERPHDANHEQLPTAAHGVSHEPKHQAGPVESIHEAAAKTVETERVPSSIPKDVAQYSVGKFTVQIGSFASKVEAEKRSTELSDKGYKAFVIPAKINGKSWFRVSVGLFATEKEAKDYKSEFMAKGKVENAIVQKILN